MYGFPDMSFENDTLSERKRTDGRICNEDIWLVFDKATSRRHERPSNATMKITAPTTIPVKVNQNPVANKATLKLVYAPESPIKRQAKDVSPEELSEWNRSTENSSIRYILDKPNGVCEQKLRFQINKNSTQQYPRTARNAQLLKASLFDGLTKTPDEMQRATRVHPVPVRNNLFCGFPDNRTTPRNVNRPAFPQRSTLRSSIGYRLSRFNSLFDQTRCIGRYEEPTPILLDFLYLGNCISSIDQSCLISHRISNILNVAAGDVDERLAHFQPEDEMTVKRVYLADIEEADLLRHVTECVQFLDNVCARQQRVLVHCSHGQSRSPAVVVAYMMIRRHMNLEDCLRLLLKKRPCVSPNNGFLRQLMFLENTLLRSVTQYNCPQ